MVQQACLNLASINSKKGNWVEVAKYLELFLEKYPEDIRCTEVMYKLGGAYENMGELELAAEVYSAFKEKTHSEDPRIKVLMDKIESWQGAQK